MHIDTIEKCGRFQGKAELLNFMRGKRLTRKAGIKAKCFECMGGYADGSQDCLVATCPLYPWMPFLDPSHREIRRSTEVKPENKHPTYPSGRFKPRYKVAKDCE